MGYLGTNWNKNLVLLHKCDSAAVMDCNINTCISRWSLLAPVKGRPTHKGVSVHRMRTTDLKGQRSNNDTGTSKSICGKIRGFETYVLFYFTVCVYVCRQVHICV